MESGTPGWKPGSGAQQGNLERAPSYHELQISYHFEELGRIQGDDKCTVSDLYHF